MPLKDLNDGGLFSNERSIFYQGNAINYKEMRQLDRKDTVLSENGKSDVNSQFPIHPPTGERTRKTYDFTSRK